MSRQFKITKSDNSSKILFSSLQPKIWKFLTSSKIVNLDIVSITKRITEDGINRITEDGTQRILE